MSTNNLPAQVTESAPVRIGFNDAQSFDLIQRVAKCFALSTLVPKAYQGNQPNCIIALNMASRMGADPMMVMQNLYVVHGTPSWSAQFLIATFNKNGKFSSIRYDFFGTEGQDDWGCRAKATELETGELLVGPLVTVALAKKECWYQKSGSKWQTMPEQMLRYRAAAWFVRTIAPEIAMGLQTAEEMRDTYEMEKEEDGAYRTARSLPAAIDINEVLSRVTGEVMEEAAPESVFAPVEPPLAQPEPVLTQAAPEVMPPEPPATRKRHTNEELDGMRADMVAEILSRGATLDDIEPIVGEYSNKWNAAQIEKIRGKILPNLLAEKMEA